MVRFVFTNLPLDTLFLLGDINKPNIHFKTLYAYLSVAIKTIISRDKFRAHGRILSRKKSQHMKKL